MAKNTLCEKKEKKQGNISEKTLTYLVSCGRKLYMSHLNRNNVGYNN